LTELAKSELINPYSGVATLAGRGLGLSAVPFPNAAIGNHQATAQDAGLLRPDEYGEGWTKSGYKITPEGINKGNKLLLDYFGTKDKYDRPISGKYLAEMKVNPEFNPTAKLFEDNSWMTPLDYYVFSGYFSPQVEITEPKKKEIAKAIAAIPSGTLTAKLANTVKFEVVESPKGFGVYLNKQTPIQMYRDDKGVLQVFVPTIDKFLGIFSER